jgi:hypothetical protein
MSRTKVSGRLSRSRGKAPTGLLLLKTPCLTFPSSEHDPGLNTIKRSNCVKEFFVFLLNE